jgi:hypothetical protein
MKNTLAQEWERFSRAVVPSDAPPVQISEMKMAFYGGALSLLSLQTKVVACDGCSEAAGSALIEAWQNEIDDFFRDRLKV